MINLASEYDLTDHSAINIAEDKAADDVTRLRNNATFGDKVEGFTNSFLDMNTIANIAHHAEYYQGFSEDKDEEFLKTYDPYAIAAKKGYGLQEGMKLSEAKNKNHMMRMIAGLDEVRDNRKKTNETIGTFGQVTSGLLGGVVDLNIPIAGIAYNMAKTSKSLSKTFFTTTALDTAESVIRYSVNDNAEKSDILLDTFISSGVNIYALKKGVNAAQVERNRMSHEQTVIESKNRQKVRLDELKAKYAERKAQATRAEELEQLRKQREQAKTQQAKDAMDGEIAKREALDVELEAKARKKEAEAKERLERTNAVIKKESENVKKAKELDKAKTEKIDVSLKERTTRGATVATAVKNAQKQINKLTTQVKRLRKKKKQTPEDVETITNLKKEIGEISYALSKGKQELKKVTDEVVDLEASKKQIEEELDTYKKIAEESDIEIQKIKESVGTDEVDEVIENATGLKRPKIDIEPTKNGGMKLTVTKKDGKKVSKKVKLSVALALGMGATNVMADDGSPVYEGINGLLILAAMGIVGKAAWRNKAELKQKVLTGKDNIVNFTKREQTFKDNKEDIDFTDSLTEKMRLSVMEAYYDIAKHGGEFESLAKTLLFDFKDSIVESVEMFKTRMTNGLGGEFAKSEELAFNKWLGRQINSGEISKFDAVAKKSEIRHKFREEVSDVIEGVIKTDDASILEVVDAWNKMVKNTKALAKHYDMLGADGKMIDGGYIPRMWRHSVIKNLISGADNAGKETIKQALKDAILTNNPKASQETLDQTVNGLMDWFTNVSHASGNNTTNDMFDDVFEYIKGKYGDVNAGEIAKLFNTQGDRVNRFKERIDMDLSKLDNLTITQLDGSTKTINKTSFVERNVFNLTQDYLNSMMGHIGLAKNGYNSEQAIDDVINNLAKVNPKAAQKLVQAKTLALGRPLIDSTAEETRFVSSVRNIAIAKSLPLVALSTVPEMLTTLAKAFTSGVAGRQLIREMKTYFSKFDPLDDEMRMWAEVTGRGNGTILHDTSIRGIMGDTVNISEGVGGIEKNTGKLRDTVIEASQLTKLSEKYERVAIAHFKVVLSKHLSGEKILNAKYKKQFGITEDVENLLRDVLVLNERGNIDAKVIDNLSIDQKDALGKVMNAMVQGDIQHATIGGSPLMFNTSNVGRIMATLLSFSINAYSNLGLRRINNGDINSAIATTMWLTGGYLSAHARAAITGQDLDDETAIKRAMLSMPLAGPLAFTQAGNNPSLQIMSEASKATDMYH